MEPLNCTAHEGAATCSYTALITTLAVRMEQALDQMAKDSERSARIEASLVRLEKFEASVTGGYRFFLALLTVLGTVGTLAVFWQR